MAINNFQFSIFNFQKKRGFALLVAVIFMSVMLALGLALSSLGYKQELLASTAIESQYAFYAADAGMECVLYADQQQNSFDYNLHDAENPPSAIVCDGIPAATRLNYAYDDIRLVVSERLSLDANTRCADITVYKYETPQPKSTYIFSQGYDVPCTTVAIPGGARFVSRGISSDY